LQNRIYDSEGISTAVTTGFHPAYKMKFNNKIRVFESDKVSGALGTNCGSSTSSGGGVIKLKQTKGLGKNIGYIIENGTAYVFRRQTPLECFRLMGVKDSDFHKLYR